MYDIIGVIIDIVLGVIDYGWWFIGIPIVFIAVVLVVGGIAMAISNRT